MAGLQNEAYRFSEKVQQFLKEVTDTAQGGSTAALPMLILNGGMLSAHGKQLMGDLENAAAEDSRITATALQLKTALAGELEALDNVVTSLKAAQLAGEQLSESKIISEIRELKGKLWE